MRLSKVRLAGFKSFVDPTLLDLRSNLVGILGPNGCGKSNTIDAVRWVMGESSAKNLRGQSMEDVIFNGSSSRKPVGQASVELIFDNSEQAGKKNIGAEYTHFDELSIKRLVNREGQSKYFLNSTRCRRRDITDIFLGTGLGPRSYAIIEQGMISRLIDAKPDELRIYIEEAAGISKYKERRRETANRIQHTRENLERLSDLRDELDKQLNRLKRQADNAERFTQYKQEERELAAHILVLKYQDLHILLEKQQQTLNASATKHQQQLSTQRHLEAQLIEQRQQQDESHALFNKKQANYYQIRTDIAQIEQQIQHQKEQQQRQQKAQQQTELHITQSQQHIAHEQSQHDHLQEQLAELSDHEKQAATALQAANQALDNSEQQQNQWQETWLNQQVTWQKPREQAQLAQSRMVQLNKQIEQSDQRLQRLQQEQTTLNDHLLLNELDELRVDYEIAQHTQYDTEQQLAQHKQTAHTHQHHVQNLEKTLADARLNAQQLQGQLASLEALQQAGLGKDYLNDKDHKQWQAWGWDQQTRLGELIQLADTFDQSPDGSPHYRQHHRWQTALEQLLEQDLQALCLRDLDEHLDRFSDYSQHLRAFECMRATNPHSQQTPQYQAHPDHPIFRQPLADKIQSPLGLKVAVAHIYCVDQLEQALRHRHQLNAGQFFLTLEGICVGKTWLRTPTKNSIHEGVLARQQQLKTVQAAFQQQQQHLAELENQLQNAQTAWQTQQNEQDTLTEQYQQQQAELYELNAHIDREQQRYEQTEYRLEQLQEETEALSEQLENDRIDYADEQLLYEQASTELTLQTQQREQLEAQRNTLQQQLHAKRQAMKDCQDHWQTLRLACESTRQQQIHSQQTLQRLQAQLIDQQAHYEQLLEEQLSFDDTALETLHEQHQQLLQTHLVYEQQLKLAQNDQQSLDKAIQANEKARHEAEQQANQWRDQIETQKLQWQESQVRATTLREQFHETGFDFEAIQANFSADVDIAQQEAALKNVQQRIQRLGSINLAAIDEYQETLERKHYLDEQNHDLETALATLERVIQTMDKETRGRFKSTFESINTQLRANFPKLFGGGEAYLALTEQDLLNTGVSIMARPPGKKIASIQLLSGGEKALTAVALVFAIFSLNPAPFCMLDEVDAPLDEANVGRFCQLVREMSQHVQFIFITHNKVTMELAENLIGVTMRESGVSRLVSVDLAEAVQVLEKG
ncbi:MAG: chromosome segregation protein SMC [bacterium]